MEARKNLIVDFNQKKIVISDALRRELAGVSPDENEEHVWANQVLSLDVKYIMSDKAEKSIKQSLMTSKELNGEKTTEIYISFPMPFKEHLCLKNGGT